MREIAGRMAFHFCGVGRPPGSVNRSQTRARLLPTHRVEALSAEYEQQF